MHIRLIICGKYYEPIILFFSKRSNAVCKDNESSDGVMKFCNTNNRLVMVIEDSFPPHKYISSKTPLDTGKQIDHIYIFKKVSTFVTVN